MIPDWTAIVLIGTLLLNAFIGITNRPHVAKSLEGTAVEAFEKAAASVAIRNAELITFISKLEAASAQKDRDTAELARLLAAEQILCQKYKDWAERLVYQVRMIGAGIPPVPFEQYPAQADTVKKS